MIIPELTVGLIDLRSLQSEISNLIVLCFDWLDAFIKQNKTKWDNLPSKYISLHFASLMLSNFRHHFKILTPSPVLLLQYRPHHITYQNGSVLSFTFVVFYLVLWFFFFSFLFPETHNFCDLSLFCSFCLQ